MDMIRFTKPANTPKLSIIVSVYNRANHLYNCLSSLIRQSSTEFEVIVSEDGFNRSVYEVVSDFGSQGNIRYIRDVHQDCVAKVRNRGLSEARGEFVLFLDADVILERSFIERLLIHCSKFPSTIQNGRVLALRRILHDDEDWRHLDSIATPISPLEDDVDEEYAIAREKFFAGSVTTINSEWWCLMGCCFSAPRNSLLRIGGFCEEFKGWGVEDTELASRLHYFAKLPMLWAGDCIAYHQRHYVDPERRRSRQHSENCQLYQARLSQTRSLLSGDSLCDGMSDTTLLDSLG